MPSLYFQPEKRFGANAVLYSTHRLLWLEAIAGLAVFGTMTLGHVMSTQVVANLAICATLFLMVPGALFHSPQCGIGRWGGIRRWFLPPAMPDGRAGIRREQPRHFVIYLIVSVLIVQCTCQTDL